MDIIQELFRYPLPSARSGAFFNAFSYPTKISPEAIAVYIATLTKPGDLVVDTFGGSGSTGIATLLCEFPTEKMKKLAKELNVEPEWGTRNACVYEIGTYGSFASKTITSRLKAEEFKKAVDSFLKAAEELVNKFYITEDIEGKRGYIRHVIWSEALVCPKCGSELCYFDEGVQRNPVKFKKDIVCSHCNTKTNIDEMKAVVEKYYDHILGKEITRKKTIPVWIYGVTDGKNWDRRVNEHDIKQIENIENQEYYSNPKEIQWGDLHRKGYHYGITHLHHFYTKRNYMVMDQLWKMTNEYAPKERDALRLLLLSYNSSHCTKMTRVVAKKNSKDFVLTGSQSGVLYISKLPVEKNIIFGLKRKAKPIQESFKLLEKCTGIMDVKNKSSQKMDEQAGSVDLVFTDPPFGDFIPYAEVNQINELWLGDTTNRKEEIIISDSQNKNLESYKNMLTTVFSEMHRVMRDDTNAIVVFHAAKAQIWEAFEKAITDAGLTVKLTNILNKEQASFKQVVSEDSVQSDPLLLLSKGESVIISQDDLSILNRVISREVKKTEFDERRVYSLYVNECLENNICVTIDAKKAYAIIREKREEVLHE